MDPRNIPDLRAVAGAAFALASALASTLVALGILGSRWALAATGASAAAVAAIIMSQLSSRRAEAEYARALDRIATGQEELHEPGRLTRNGFPGLAGRFTAFLDRLSAFVIGIKNVHVQAQTLGIDIASNTKHIDATIGGIASDSDAMSREYSSLLAELTDAEAAVEEIRGFTRDVSRLVGDQSRAAGVSDLAMGEFVETIGGLAVTAEAKMRRAGELGLVAERGGEDLETTLESIKIVADSAGVILESLSIIGSISERTNLLAMNAAIEAAHAGESGKGFTVVADEVRRLAEETGENAARMGQDLNTVLSTVETMRSASERMSGSIQLVFNGMRELGDSLDQIRAETLAIRDTGGGIKASLGDVLERSQRVDASSREMESRADRLDALVRRLRSLADGNAVIMERLGEAVSRIRGAVSVLVRLGRSNTSTADAIREAQGSFKAGGNVVSENMPPYNYVKDGKAVGMNVALCEEIFRRLGLPLRFELMPLESVVERVAARPGTIGANLMKTAHRLEKFKFVGPFVHSEFWVFKLASNPLTARSLADLKPGRMAIVRGDGLVEYFMSKGFAEGRGIVFTSDPNESLLKLIDGTVDTCPMTEDNINYQLTVMERSKSLVSRLIRIDEIPGDLYALFDKSVPDSVVERFQSVLDDMKRSGVYDRIVEANRF